MEHDKARDAPRRLSSLTARASLAERPGPRGNNVQPTTMRSIMGHLNHLTRCIDV